MPEIDQKYIQDKFIEYCKVNTRSDEQSTTVPTTVGQVDLLKIIEKELSRIYEKKTINRNDFEERGKLISLLVMLAFLFDINYKRF